MHEQRYHKKPPTDKSQPPHRLLTDIHTPFPQILDTPKPPQTSHRRSKQSLCQSQSYTHFLPTFCHEGELARVGGFALSWRTPDPRKLAGGSELKKVSACSEIWAVTAQRQRWQPGFQLTPTLRGFRRSSAGAAESLQEEAQSAQISSRYFPTLT